MQNKILGFTDEVTTCGCCGRSDLKGTYVIEGGESGTIDYFGSVCVQKFLKATASSLKAMLGDREADNILIAKEEYRASPEKCELEQHLVDREPKLKNASRETYFAIITETNRLSDRAAKVKADICKKYLIRKKHLVC